MPKVVGWCTYTNDLVDDPRTDTDAVWDCVVEDIVANKYCFGGYDHQYAVNCVPVVELDDGTQLPSTYTMRAWGRLMAVAWNKILGRDYEMMEFYYRVHEPDLEVKMPENRQPCSNTSLLGELNVDN